MLFQKIIVYKIPPGRGRGVYSQLKAYILSTLGTLNSIGLGKNVSSY